MVAAIDFEIVHSVTGLVGEVGELADHIEKVFFFGSRQLDKKNIEEEIGDCLWYLACLADTIGTPLGTIMERNIAKLKSRYPDKFDVELSKEENRNRVKEQST